MHPTAIHKRAAIYARYSTELQSGRSIEDQVALCREHASRSGLTVTHVFSDAAKSSASIFGREGLAQMMETSRLKAFDVIIVEALDRLSRDQADLAQIHKRLRFDRIEILTVHDGVVDSVAVGLRGLMGEMFLDAFRAKTRRGLAGVIRDGRHAGGQTYGYEGIPGAPGERRIVDAEADVIREIFTRYVAGESPRTIAGDLNARGILPPRGRRWAASSINGNRARGYGILRNPMYDGRLVWNRVTMVRDPDTGRRVNRENPPDEWQEVTAEALRIVSADLFKAAQERSDERSHGVRSGQMMRAPLRPFSGLIRCGCCGGGMAIHDRKGSAIRIRCSAATESGSCDNRGRYRLDRIEAAIFDRLRETLARPDYAAEFVRAYGEERRRLAGAARANLAALQRAEAEATNRFARLVDMMARGLIDGPEADAQVIEAKAARDRARAELTNANEADRVVTLHPKAASLYADAIFNLGQAIQSDDGRFDPDAAAALRRLITGITVTPGADAAANVDIWADMEALLGLPSEMVGGSVVARGGLEPPTPRL